MFGSPSIVTIPTTLNCNEPNVSPRPSSERPSVYSKDNSYGLSLTTNPKSWGVKLYISDTFPCTLGQAFLSPSISKFKSVLESKLAYTLFFISIVIFVVRVTWLPSSKPLILNWLAIYLLHKYSVRYSHTTL